MSHTKTLAETWGETIRETRREQGLSLEALAERTGIDAGHLSRGERGLAGFGDAHRISLARALGRQVGDLFPYPEITSEDPACPSADSATDAGPSPTRPTRAARRSPAPSAAGPAESAPAANPATEVA